MALSNREKIGKGLEVLVLGLNPFIERELKNWRGPTGLSTALNEIKINNKNSGNLNDIQTLLSLLFENWVAVFSKTLGKAEKSYCHELKECRNKWAHGEAFPSNDAERALDTMERLLASVSAGEQVEEIKQQRMDLKRLIFDEQLRSKSRQPNLFPTEGKPSVGLKSWREIATPHPDVASGKFQQAEFAADLWQVYENRGSEEYKNPTEFFRRTYLTQGLKDLLANAILRIAQQGGDPVVELQTNFGGGKTHSMLALYHLFSGVKPADLPGVDDLMKERNLPPVIKAHRAVFVGTMVSPGGRPANAEGIRARTIWGEIAWQLGGKAGFELVREDDERATSPGDQMAVVFRQFGPCLILIDEWVAYARQLHDKNDLPGGSFDTQFTFAQTLTEAAKAAPGTLVVLSIPASESSDGKPSRGATEIEVGGEKGLDALRRLKNAIGRVQTPWRPASSDEGFEIVRRRLFQPMNNTQMVERDKVARAFVDWYKDHSADFPPETKESEYERRIKMAYPIHPELFDRLFEDWSTSEKFQRTRGVLRLMATVIHALWKNNDGGILILPGMVPLDASEVQSEVTRYLEEQWVPILEKDIDGTHSLPLKIDAENNTQGRYSATRRVARTIFLGSAPTQRSERKGIDDRRIKLGSVQPGESPASFGDALRKLTEKATFLYEDQSRYWYSTVPTVKRLADDRAANLKPDIVHEQMRNNLRSEVKNQGDFSRVHVCAQALDIPDERETRLVILDPEHAHSAKERNSPALEEARKILESRGTGPRMFRNALVFLAADAKQLALWEDSIRKWMAWTSIWEERVQLNLDALQTRQVETQLKTEANTVAARLGQSYQWLIFPAQDSPSAEVEWKDIKISNTPGQSLAVSASKKIGGESRLTKKFSETLLRADLDKIPLWQGNHISVKLLADYYAQYVYLQRLTSEDVLLESIKRGVANLAWENTFAYAQTFDPQTGKYLGLEAGITIEPLIDGNSVLVKSDIAKAQRDAEKPPPSLLVPVEIIRKVVDGKVVLVPDITPQPPTPPPGPAPKRRFFATVSLPNNQTSMKVSTIVNEVILHFTNDPNCTVELKLEIEAKLSAGFSETIQRTVRENARSLKFTQESFEE